MQPKDIFDFIKPYLPHLTPMEREYLVRQILSIDDQRLPPKPISYEEKKIKEYGERFRKNAIKRISDKT